MSHKTIRRGIAAGLGVAAATLGAAGLAATAHADDIDMYGGQDVMTYEMFNGTAAPTIFTTTTSYYETVDETTGVITPHFSLPVTVETMGTLAPGVTQEGGYSFFDSNTGYFGDITNVIGTQSVDTDAFLANGNDLTQFLPVFVTDLFSPGVPDMDPFPF